MSKSREKISSQENNEIQHLLAVLEKQSADLTPGHADLVQNAIMSIINWVTSSSWELKCRKADNEMDALEVKAIKDLVGGIHKLMQDPKNQTADLYNHYKNILQAAIENVILCSDVSMLKKPSNTTNNELSLLAEKYSEYRAAKFPSSLFQNSRQSPVKEMKNLIHALSLKMEERKQYHPERFV